MKSLYETAYPRFKKNITKRELEKIYTPSSDELNFACRNTQHFTDRLMLLVLIKTGQRLGYFVIPTEVPENIVAYIAKCAGVEKKGKKVLRRFSQAGSLQRLRELSRKFLNLKALTADSENLILKIAKNAAQTKQELADIINVVIEELVRQRFELPGFTTLQRSARHARSIVNNQLYCSIHEELSKDLQNELDALLEISDNDSTSEWHRLKKEPKKPTSKEVRNYLLHLKWLKSWVGRLPKVNAISTTRWRQLVLEARALDANALKRVKPSKRYTLIVVLIHSTLRAAMDDTVHILIRKINSIHNRARQQLQDYHLERSKKVEDLISQFRDVIHAYQKGVSDSERILGIKTAFRDDPEKLEKTCDEHMAYAGNNYIPFMLGSYRNQRPLFLNCLELLNVQASSNDKSIIEAIEFLFNHRHSHKPTLNIENSHLNLNWLSEKWLKVITGKSSTTLPIKEVHRLYFELCVLTQVVTELKSGDLFVENSEEYSDYRDQLISWDQYDEQVEEYRASLLGYPIILKSS